MKNHASRIGIALLASLLLGAPGWAAETMVTGGGGGVFPPDTTFSGLRLTGVAFGFGLEFSETGAKVGDFNAVLAGVTLAGLQRSVTVEGNVTAGSRGAANVATFSGTATVDMGTGAPPLSGVPFIATVTTNPNGQGALGLTIGVTALPAAATEVDTITISAPPAP